MDIIQDLARKSQPSPDAMQQISKVSKLHLMDWMHSLSEIDSPLNNLELLLHLHETDRLQITTYVHFCQNLTALGDLISSHVTSSIEDQVKIGSDVLSVLMCVQESVSAHHKCSTLLDHCIKHLSTTLSSNSQPVSKLVTYLVGSKYRLQFVLQTFLEDIINETLLVNESFSVDYNEHLYSVASRQKINHLELRQHCFYNFLQEVFKVLSSKDTLQLYESNFIAENIDWNGFLIFTSAHLSRLGESNVSSFLEFIDHAFKSSLSTQNEAMTLKSLLLIRQCCLEIIKPVYSSYANWFSNLPIKNKLEFEFFFRVLSALVPYENAMELKIHINKAPSIPLNCQATFSEYSQLAKTKLKDLNETTEYLGLFGTTEQEDRLEDVRKVLSHFASTNEIADIVLKACVFRREYYQDIFLRDLLNLRDPALRSLQLRFVEKLHQVGKLPHALYADWPLKP